MKQFYLIITACVFLYLSFVSCAPLLKREPLGVVEKGNKEYEKVQMNFAGIKWDKYELIQSSWDKTKQNLEILSFWFLVVGALLSVGSIIACLFFHSERFIVALCKKTAIAGGLVFCFGLMISALATWITWVFLGILIILAGWLIHKYRDKDAINGAKNVTIKAKEKAKAYNKERNFR